MSNFVPYYLLSSNPSLHFPIPRSLQVMPIKFLGGSVLRFVQWEALYYGIDAERFSQEQQEEFWQLLQQTGEITEEVRSDGERFTQIKITPSPICCTFMGYGIMSAFVSRFVMTESIHAYLCAEAERKIKALQQYAGTDNEVISLTKEFSDLL